MKLPFSYHRPLACLVVSPQRGSMAAMIDAHASPVARRMKKISPQHPFAEVEGLDVAELKALLCAGHGGQGQSQSVTRFLREVRCPHPVTHQHLEICRSCSACACTRVRLCVCVCVCVCCVWSWGALPAQTPRNYTVHLSPGSTPHVCRALTHPACQPRRAHRQWRSTGCWSSAGSTVGRPVHFCARSSIGLSCVCTPT